jgi:hypothetical protein
MTFCKKDINSFNMDVNFVREEMAQVAPEQTQKGLVSKFVWETNSYTVTKWIHHNYNAILAIAKDGSHTVTWYEINGEIHRW